MLRVFESFTTHQHVNIYTCMPDYCQVSPPHDLFLEMMDAISVVFSNDGHRTGQTASPQDKAESVGIKVDTACA